MQSAYGISRRSQNGYLWTLAATQFIPAGGVIWVVLAAAVFKIYPTGLDLALCFGFLCLTMVGMEVGYHRFFAHAAFRTSARMQYALAILGSTALNGGVIWWTAMHKKHHALSDREGDPHSPYARLADGRLQALYHAHFGWMFDRGSVALGTWSQHVLPLYRDPVLFWINQHYLVIGVLGILLPSVVGAAITGTWTGAMSALVWGGLIRVFLANHAMFSLNSFCHMFGSKPFASPEDNSRNNAWFVLPTLGGAWHNNHHAFPRTATNQFRWWEFDPAGMAIFALEKLGVIWGVYRPSPEIVAARRMRGGDRLGLKPKGSSRSL